MVARRIGRGFYVGPACAREGLVALGDNGAAHRLKGACSTTNFALSFKLY